ncbi:phenylacetate--CoA ligase family protein [Amycolatopsis aidingensis]|uniref:phenylacetate--CoA ligase family protein n=1 Tax=Amycolatopsis aidingensis TaxID=2842453 RepID=UPI001C0AD0CF|nr:phenylacetate--CoA ligase family protein [Amycolatopsis aidingensis]
MTITEAFEASFAGAVDELAFAYREVPFYGPHLDAAGVRPAQVRSPADFRRVPATTKADYRRNFPAGVLVRGTKLADEFVFRSRSSGTTGERLVTLAHTFTLAERQLRTTAVHPGMLAVFAGAREQRVCRYAPPACSDVECATPFTTPETRTLPDGTLVLPVAHDLLATGPELVGQAIRELTEHRPHWLYADPAHLAFLLDAMRERGLPPPEAAGVVLAYNLATGAALRRIRDHLPAGTVVVEVASMSELGWLGMTCPDGFLHLNTESFYLELLRYGTDHPAGPGELAELYATSIGDQLSPHIRYRTGDGYVLLEGTCRCGNAAPRVVHHGRCADYLEVAGEVVLTPRILDELVGPAEWLTFYKLTHRESGPLLLRYVPVPGTAHREHAATLAAAIGDRTGREVAVSAVDYIESERSGKLFGCVRAVHSGESGVPV